MSGEREILTSETFSSSRRGSSNLYTAVKYTDGTFACNCPGWRFKKTGMKRYCGHTGNLGDTKRYDRAELTGKISPRNRDSASEQFVVVKSEVLTLEEMRMVDAGRSLAAIASVRARTGLFAIQSKKIVDDYREAKGLNRTIPLKQAAAALAVHREIQQAVREASKPNRARIAFDEEV